MSDTVDTKTGEALFRELIREGLNVYAKATGPSMFPIIRAGDKVLVEPKSGAEINIGDIVLYEKDGSYIIHRLIRKTGQSTVVTKGDNLSWSDSPIPTESILGKVVRIEGHGRRLALTGRLNRIFARVIAWLAGSRIRGKTIMIRNLNRLWRLLEGRRIV
jgi:signal peptidase I